MTEKSRLAVIGVGGMAQGHTEQLLKMPEVELTEAAWESAKAVGKVTPITWS